MHASHSTIDKTYFQNMSISKHVNIPYKLYLQNKAILFNNFILWEWENETYRKIPMKGALKKYRQNRKG